MANLIITIIAIALTAILAIAGAWYGSSAFQEAQAKAEANKILSNFKQADGAIKVFAVENGGSLPDCLSDWPVNCGYSYTFTPNEMSSFLEPRYSQAGFFAQSRVRPYRALTNANGYLVVFGPDYTKLNGEVCRQLEALRTAVLPSTNRIYNTGTSAGHNKSACGQFGCFADSADNAWGVTVDYIAYYRHAGTPQPASADCTINP